MGAFRLRREHSGVLLGVVLAGVLLGVWNAAQAGPAAGLRLSRYQAAGGPALLGLAGGSAVLAAAPATPAARVSADTVIGPPTLSAALMDSILGEYGSPAAGQGAVFYQMGVKYGIDPAFALAFYVHESAAGTKGVARFTHGIGNIRTTPGYADYEGYRSYPTFAAGIEDWFQLIRTLYVDGWGLRTVTTIVPRYAPAADGNDVPSYIADVQGLVASWWARAAR